MPTLNRDQCYKLLGILQEIAPNGEAQAILAAQYCEAEMASDEAVERYCVITLADAVIYGNWPWLLSEVPR